MTAADLWVVGYVAIVGIAAATIVVRREPTLVRGRAVLLATALYLAAAGGHLAWRGGQVPARIVVAAGVMLALALAASPWWFVLGGPRAAVLRVIEVCFGRVCAQFSRTDRGFAMTVPGGDLHVRVHAAPAERLTILSFRARPPHRKGKLFQRLLVKQYAGPLPTLRIRFR